MLKYTFLLLPLLLTSCLSSVQMLNRVESYNADKFKIFASHVPEHLQEIRIMDKNNSWYEDRLTVANADITKTIYSNLDYSFLPSYASSKKIRSRQNIKDLEKSIQQRTKRTNIKTSANFFSFEEDGFSYKAEIIARLNWNEDNIKDYLLYFEEYSTQNKLLASYYLIITDLTKPIKAHIISKKNAYAKNYTVYIQKKKKNTVQVYDIGEVEVVEKPKAQKNKEPKSSTVKALEE